tara:strand:- start:121 stop:756 length:636 start_codon:yes stop_codon:yes gene_type:complete
MNPLLINAFTDELEKVAASKLRRGIRLIEDVIPVQGLGGRAPSPQRSFRLELNGKIIGGTAIQDGQILGRLHIDKEYRGMGLGKKFLGELMRAVPKLHSGNTVGEKGRWLWERAAKRKGYKITRRPAKEVRHGGDFSVDDLGNQSLQSLSNKPVFSGSLPRAAAKKPDDVHVLPKYWKEPKKYLEQMERRGLWKPTAQERSQAYSNWSIAE